MSGQETGPIVLQVTNEVQKAGGEFTLAHFQDEGWFAEWKRKLWEAGGVVIIFSDKYRGRFTEALQMEAAQTAEELRLARRSAASQEAYLAVVQAEAHREWVKEAGGKEEEAEAVMQEARTVVEGMASEEGVDAAREATQAVA